ncbi:MAG: sulfite exporter TauE/SafE family protein [Caldilineaceae bacterium]|nr:sulfite exporter TauE/SafE family protein [Caldilineaceae bacterium]
MTQIAQDPQRATGSTPSRVQTKTAAAENRLVVFLHALAFVLGFAAVFTLVGSAAGLLGYSLYPYMRLIQQIGAVLLVIFALVTLGVFRWLVNQMTKRIDLQQNPAAAALVSFLEFFNRLLYTERRVTEMHQVNRNWGYLSSAMLGVSFSAGWVPCVGPILASICFLAQDSATAAQGAGLLAIYSLGLGIPFLITGAAFSSMSTFLRRLNRHANVVSIISGVFLLYVAYLLWSDSLALLTTRFFFLNEWVFSLEDWISGASGTGGDLISLSFIAAAPLALIAGLISFISPCVLPLVPAYIGYLSGAAVGSNK